MSSGTHILTGRDFGAIRVARLEDLYEAQRLAVVDIATGIHKVACESFEERRPFLGNGETQARRALRHNREYQRPHNNFVVDGVRGSGKTTALLTIRNLVDSMTLGPPVGGSRDDWAEARSRSEGGRTFSTDLATPRETEDALRKLDLQPPLGSHGGERVALLLPVVITEDMEPREAAMDAVFALLQQQLDEELAKGLDAKREQHLKDLRDELKSRVTLP